MGGSAPVVGDGMGMRPTSGNHEVRAVDELGYDGGGRGEEGKQIWFLPEGVHCV